MPGFEFSCRWNAIAKHWLLLTAERLSGCCVLQGGSAHRRHGRSNARGLGAKTQLLKRFLIKLAGRIQHMCFLEFSGRFNRRSVPFSVWLPCERTVLRERLLDLGNAVRSRNLLSPLPPAGSPGPFPARSAPCLGGSSLLWRCRLCRGQTREHTRPR